MRQRPLNADGVTAATKVIMESLRRAGVELPPTMTTRGHILLVATVRSALHAYKDHETIKKGNGRRYSGITKQMAEMKVGQMIELPLQPLQSIRQRMDTSRLMMENSEATWILEQGKGCICCTRIEDGSSTYYRDPARNPKTRELCSLKVGQVIISETILSVRGKGQMGSNTKIMARRLLQEPDADWTVQQTNHGVRLRRIR